MNIIRLNNQTLALGKLAFSAYQRAVLCGSGANLYQTDIARETGLAVVPGAILACMDQGLNTEDQILNAVARTSRCRRSTVRVVLNALSGADPAQHLWIRLSGDRYRLLETASDNDKGGPSVLLAA